MRKLCWAHHLHPCQQGRVWQVWSQGWGQFPLAGVCEGHPLRLPPSAELCSCAHERYVRIHVHLLMIWQTAQQNYQIRTKDLSRIKTLPEHKYHKWEKGNTVSSPDKCIQVSLMYTIYVNQQTTCTSPEKAGPDVMQSNPLCRMHFRQYQASSVVLGWLGDGDCCTECSQVAGLIHIW